MTLHPEPRRCRCWSKGKADVSRGQPAPGRLQLDAQEIVQLARRIQNAAGGNYRAFVDSAPVLERAHTTKSGQGCVAKTPCLISRDGGSLSLGEESTCRYRPASPTPANTVAVAGRVSRFAPPGHFVGPSPTRGAASPT